MSINFNQFTKKAMLTLFSSYMKVKSKNKAHAVLSASGSERWLGCPGSVRISEGIPSIDTEWSTAGTHAHTLLQFILENIQWKYLLAQSEAAAFKKFIGYSEAQLGSVMIAVNYVRREQDRMLKETGTKATLMVEQKVELEGVGFGTADIILYQPFGVLHVMDFKNGQSAIEAEQNTQGLYYAHAAADLYGWDFREVWITILQPNASHKHGPIRTWKTTPKRLEQEGKRFRVGAKLTQARNAPLVVDTKWCWFCPARNICPEQMKGKQTKIMDRFSKPEREKDHGKEKSSQEKEAGKKEPGKVKSFCDAF